MPDSNEKRIRFACPRCEREIGASSSLIGKRLRCRHCKSVVPVPHSVSHTDDAEDEEYRLQEESPPPAPIEAVEKAPAYIPLICSACSARMAATVDQEGLTLICPDCHTANVVSPPAPRRTVPDVSDLDDDDIRLSPPVEIVRPKLEDSLAEITGSSDTEPRSEIEMADISTSHWIEHDTSTPIDIPKRLPTFFLFEPDVFIRLFSMTILGCGALFMIRAANLRAFAPSEVLEGADNFAMSLLLAGIGFPLAILWISVTAVYGMSVAQDTSTGNDTIESWPEGVWFEWMFDAKVVFAAMSVSLVLPLFIHWLVTPPVPLTVLMVVGGIVILFPVFMLSMSEGNSVFAPFVYDVWRTLWSSSGAWTLFYIQAAALMTICGSVLYATYCLEKHSLGGYLNAPLVALTMVTGTLLYFRQFGKLSRSMNRELEEETADSETEEHRP